MSNVIEEASRAVKEEFIANLGRTKLSPEADQVADNMLTVTILEALESVEKPELWWRVYKNYAFKHAQLIAQVALALSQAGQSEEIGHDDLVSACDIIVHRARDVCPEAEEDDGLGTRTGCRGYTTNAIRVV